MTPNMTDYAADRAAFHWAPPPRFNFARDVLDHWAQDPLKLALWWIDDAGHEQQLTFAELSTRAQRLCHVLSDAGIRQGDTVIVVLPRLVAWWEVVTACLRMGVVVSPGTTQLAPNDLAYRIDAAQARAVITDERNAASMRLLSRLGFMQSLREEAVFRGERCTEITLERRL